MKKGVRILCVVIVLGIAFVFGWRVMPKIWPGIKRNIVCRILPQTRPEPETEEEPELYTPKSSSRYGDEIAKTDSLIYYFYKDYCPYCMALEPLMAGLPDQITLPDGTVSKVRLLCLNKVEEGPAVVIGDRYLFLEEEVVDQLMDALMAGEGLQTQMLDGAQRQGEGG